MVETNKQWKRPQTFRQTATVLHDSFYIFETTKVIIAKKTPQASTFTELQL
jgi:hypothetical protein